MRDERDQKKELSRTSNVLKRVFCGRKVDGNKWNDKFISQHQKEHRQREKLKKVIEIKEERKVWRDLQREERDREKRVRQSDTRLRTGGKARSGVDRLTDRTSQSNVSSQHCLKKERKQGRKKGSHNIALLSL
mmetsp:Transcript_41731/g.82388  ORF Transcript_41731/g.82388 Transcript_41731/m.82388 type:complete len:133 (+) Transcript_41731:2061-2459(+)